MNTVSFASLSFASTSFHLAVAGTPISSKWTLRSSVFFSLVNKILMMINLLLGWFGVTLFVEQLVDEVLEDLLSVFFVDVLKTGVAAHKPRDYVKLTHAREVLPLLFKQVLKTLSLLLNISNKLMITCWRRSLASLRSFDFCSSMNWLNASFLSAIDLSTLKRGSCPVTRLASSQRQVEDTPDSCSASLKAAICSSLLRISNWARLFT